MAGRAAECRFHSSRSGFFSRQPIDAVAVNLIAVAGGDGSRVAGRATLQAGETTWMFSPDRAWAGGSYKLMIHPRLEDACGNEVGDPFERGAQASVVPIRHTIELPFRIQ